MESISRRGFLKAGVAGGVLAGLDLSGFLPSVYADEGTLPANAVSLRPEIEPLVRLLERTPRERVIEEFATRVQRGLSYEKVLAALFLAGVRNVQPRPYVGFKFHAVLVVNSVHLASLKAAPEHRWIPIFWALDYFKSAQARDTREGNWTMRAADEKAVPDPSKARAAWIKAMDGWDIEAADAATAGLARGLGASEVFELYFRYGARDFRDIGHKSIFVANSWRTLQCIGWRHAEPILRSLSYALLNTYEDGNPATSDHAADRPWRVNAQLARRIRKDWSDGRQDPKATRDLLAMLRTASESEAPARVVELLNKGVSAQSIWDAYLLGAVELLARQPGIISLHAVTSTNAIRFAFARSSNDETRRRLLLQNASFLTLFRKRMEGRAPLRSLELDRLEAPDSAPKIKLDTVFQALGKDPLKAARLTLGYLEQGGDPGAFSSAARLLVFLKGHDSHDYKYSSAVLEDALHVSAPWRSRFMAASTVMLKGPADKDQALVERTRQAFEQARKLPKPTKPRRDF